VAVEIKLFCVGGGPGYSLEKKIAPVAQSPGPFVSSIGMGNRWLRTLFG